MLAGTPLFKDLKEQRQDRDTGDDQDNLGQVLRDRISEGVTHDISAPDE